jgi:hypothetical protein
MIAGSVAVVLAAIGQTAAPDPAAASEGSEPAEADVPPEPEPEDDVHVPTPVPEAAAPEPAAAPEKEASEEKPSAPEQTFTAGLFIDTAYLVNSNLPDNHIYRGAITTPRTNEFTINLAVAHFEHRAVKKEPWRLQLALQAGAAADATWGEEPVPGGDDGRYAGPEAWKHIGLANAGFRVPKIATEVFGGVMSAPFGIGSLWSKDNWNYSPSWLANGSPYYFAGGAIQQPLPGGYGVYAWVVNGWQTVGDVNKVPSYLVGLTWAEDDLSAASAVYFGPETAFIAPEYWRVLSDTTLAWNRERVGVAAIVDVGQERVATSPGEPRAVWVAGAGFVRGRILQRERVALELSARPEAFWDRDGRMYGVPQTLISGTGTFGAVLFDHVLARVEYRYDHSTAPGGFFFVGQRTSPDAPGLAGDQHTVFFSLVGFFARDFGMPQPSG